MSAIASNPPLSGPAAAEAYRQPFWLPGGHLQTVYSSLLAPRAKVGYTRERWDTTPHGVADGDFVDVDRIAQRAGAPTLEHFHGLEGSSQSPYAAALMAECEQRGWNGLVVHFRGCSGELNRLPRAYHSGDAAEIDWVMRKVKSAVGAAPVYGVGVSLGGNALLKWLGEQGAAAAPVVAAAVAISAPLDLAAAGNALERGFSLFYAKHFLATMKRKSLAKLERFPGSFDGVAAARARTLREFDNVVTAPLHGYRDTDDYWLRASSKPGLADVRIPTLLINARNDPFLPEEALPARNEVSSDVHFDFPAHGGHVGFSSPRFPGGHAWLPARVLHFLERRT